MEKTRDSFIDWGRRTYFIGELNLRRGAVGYNREISQRFSRTGWHILCGNGDEINDKLDKGLVDLGIVREPFRTEKYESALIKTESWTALISREHPIAEQPR